MMQCPTAEQLERWLGHPEGSDEALAAHVDRCPRCQQILETLSAPTLSLRRAPPGPPTLPDTPSLGRLKETRPAGRAPRSPTPPVLEAVRLQSPSSAAPSRMEEEIRALLQRRLRVFSLVIAGVLFTLGVLYLGVASDVYVRYTDWGGPLLLTAALVVSLACAALVWRRTPLALPTLRVIELILFGVAAVFFAKHRYTALTRGAEGPWEGSGHQEMFLAQITLVNNTLWNFTIICYGVFIPNTWRRCVVVVSLLALTSLSITLAGGLVQPAVRERLGFLLLVSAMGLLVSAALAVFGSFRISTLQGEVLAARQLGQYVLHGRLGAGAMGEVYLAEHRLLKRPCALKLIRPERAGDPHLLDRFEREVQATARLSHPNTVAIYDYGHTDDGTFYYVMEYLSGLSLEELVDQYGPVPAARAVHFLRQLCGALREAHEAGLVHRDIKPGNVIVCRHGGLYDVVKLLDFGLVRSLEPADSGSRKLTREGLVLGTPDFMSPEQANGEVALGPRSDLYSLGALAYFLLTGKPPFPGKTVLETLVAHLHEAPAPLRDHRPEVPADLEAVVLRCLAKKPPARPASADELDRALQGCGLAEGWTEEAARRWWTAHAATPNVADGA